MKRHLLITSVLLSGTAMAQFTETNEPAISATQAMYELEPTADPYASMTGSGQVWDYSIFFGVDQSTRALSVLDPTATVEGSNFPSAEKAIEIEGFITTYITSTSTERTSPGFVYIDGTDTTVVQLSNTELLMNYPMGLSASLVDTYSGTATTTLFATPLACNGFNSAIVDGSGTLNLGSGATFNNVLRYVLIDTTSASTPFGDVVVARTQYEYYDLTSSDKLPELVHSTISISVLGGLPTVQTFVLSSAAPDGYLNVNENELTGITVYPNPANEVVSVKGLAENATLTLVDAQGKTVVAKTVEPATASLSLSNVTSGVYFLHVTSNNQTTVERVVVK